MQVFLKTNRTTPKTTAKRLVFMALDPKSTKTKNEDWILDARGCPSRIKGLPGLKNLPKKIKKWGLGVGGLLIMGL